MSWRHGVFTENFTIFFSNARKSENVPKFEFERILEEQFMEIIYT